MADNDGHHTDHDDEDDNSIVSRRCLCSVEGFSSSWIFWERDGRSKKKRLCLFIVMDMEGNQN